MVQKSVAKVDPLSVLERGTYESKYTKKNLVLAAERDYADRYAAGGGAGG